MTPREKALQLIDAFDEYAESRISDNGRGFDKKYCSKQCALIAVDEIIKDLKESLKVAEDLHLHARGLIIGSFVGWQEVKQEIEKL
jgi:hypothetical protein